jgi:hypothetical protein
MDGMYLSVWEIARELVGIALTVIWRFHPPTCIREMQ